MTQERPPKFVNTYAEAGVNRDQLQKLKAIAAEICQATKIAEVDEVSPGVFVLNHKKIANQISNPQERYETDGIGTKENLTAYNEKHKLAGWDLVTTNINDILRWGAVPKTMQIDITFTEIDISVFWQLLEGVKEACLAQGVMLTGGETAQHPDFLAKNFYHLSGTATGFVSGEKIITGEKVIPGDVVLGLPSTGLHTNGYSFATSIIDGFGRWHAPLRQLEDRSLIEVLLTPHKSYFVQVQKLLGENIEIHSQVHVTGGGLAKRLVERLPYGLSVKLNKNSWPILPIFKFLQDFGAISNSEMYKTFNMGIGWLIYLPVTDAEIAQKSLAQISEKSYIIGKVVKEE